jgi:hypothetical protein
MIFFNNIKTWGSSLSSMVATCDEKTTLHEHEEGFQVVMMIKGEHYN